MSTEREVRTLRLTWIFPRSLVTALDRATWLETSAALGQSGWRVTLIHCGQSLGDVFPGVRVIGFPRPGVYVLGYVLFHVLATARILRGGERSDVVLFEEESAPFALPLAPLRRLLGRRTPRIVMDCRTLTMDTSGARGRMRAAFFHLVHRCANRLADGQTAITPQIVDAAGISRSSLLGIWSSGVKIEKFAPAAQARRWSCAPDPLRLIYIGWMGEDRNLIGLCRAVEMAAERGLPVRLQMVGDGPQREELQQYAARRPNGPISVSPPVSGDAVPALLASADAGVLPFPDLLKFRVSSFIKMFEYMAAGLPVIATRIAAHTDVMDDGFAIWAEDGSPTALADALAKAVARRGDLPAMGARAAVAAAGWTWSESARRLGTALLRSLDAGAVE